MQGHLVSSRPMWPQLDSQAVAAREDKDPSSQPLMFGKGMFGEGMFAAASLDGSFDPPVLRQHAVPPQLHMFDRSSHPYSNFVTMKDNPRMLLPEQSICANVQNICFCGYFFIKPYSNRTTDSLAGDMINTGICSICDGACCQPLVDFCKCICSILAEQ